MIILKHFLRRFHNATPDAGGTGTVDRGDNLIPEDKDLDPDNPDGKLAEVAKDPKVQELEAELADPADPADKKKDSRIPLARHEAILNKEREQRKALEAQLAQFQKGGEIANINADITAAESQVLTLEKQYADLLTDGENEKAVKVMSEIRTLERKMAGAKNDMQIQAAVARATESARYTTALERVEASFPILNPDHADYSDETMVEVVEMMDAYKLKGLTPTDALQKAVKYVVGATTRKQEDATSVTPNVSEKDVAAERKKEAVGKTVAAVSKTPPSLARSGMDSDKLGGGADSAAAVVNMSQKEFAKLSDEALAKLRGDTL